MGNIRFRVWVEVNGEPYLGAGRIELLQRIIHSGSIARAARDMGMSYRKAWDLVKSMNHLGKKPLVEKFQGGKSGGGAFVTSDGLRAIKQFQLLQQSFNKAAAHTKSIV